MPITSKRVVQLRAFTSGIGGKGAFFVPVFMEKYTRDSAIFLLQNKYTELEKSRYPRRSDYSDAEVVAIKAFLGPWPRALEEAGIKPAREDDRTQKNREKRIRAKRRRREKQ